MWYLLLIEYNFVFLARNYRTKLDYWAIEICARYLGDAPSLGVSSRAWLGHPWFSTLRLWLANSIDDPLDYWSTIIRPFTPGAMITRSFEDRPLRKILARYAHRPDQDMLACWAFNIPANTLFKYLRSTLIANINEPIWHSNTQLVVWA